MKASEIKINNLTREEINIIISNSGLATIRPFLLKILKKSRDKNISAVELFELQGEIAQKIIFCEKQMTIFKKTANRKKHNDQWLSHEIYRAHRKFLKDVMDGIAFRLLNFERPVLRRLASKPHTGFLTEGFIKELEKAEYIISNTGFYVILNDLTNFLRYGDLTIISPERRMIDEVKTTGSAKGRQKKELDKLIEMLNKQKFTIGDQTADYISIPGKPVTFLNEVEQIIKTSKKSKSGVHAQKVSPYLWVSSTYFPKLMEYWKLNNHKFPKILKQPFSKGNISSPVDSLTFFNEFSPNMIPFTVFPFSEEVICEIMSGEIQLTAVLNDKKLIETFNGKGWDLLPPSKKDIMSRLRYIGNTFELE